MNISKLNINDVLEVNKIRNYYITNSNYIFRRCEKSLNDDVLFFEEVLSKDYPCIVLKNANELLGFAYLYPFRALDGYDKTMELSIYLKPNCNGIGLGSLLLDNIEQLSKTKYHSLISVITSDNTSSIKFHENRGFKTVGVMKEAGYVNNQYLDATFMQKILYNDDLIWYYKLICGQSHNILAL